MNRRAQGRWLDISYGLLGTIVVHAVVIGLLWLNVSWQRESTEPVQTTISARLIADEATVAQIAEPTPAPPVEPEGPTPEEIQREQDAQAERDRQAELQRQQEAQAERERAAEARRQEEAEAQRERQAAEQREREAEAQEAREEEQRRQREAEAERQRQAELKRQQEEAEAERQRQAELERQREAERKAREAAAAQARQDELEAQLRDALEAEEARAGAVNAGLLAQYIELIRQKVERSWVRPPGVADGIECSVRARQLRSGVVVSVRVTDCAGGEALARSIEQAVLKASPLPPPPDPSLFDPNLKFPFSTGE